MEKYYLHFQKTALNKIRGNRTNGRNSKNLVEIEVVNKIANAQTNSNAKDSR